MNSILPRLRQVLAFRNGTPFASEAEKYTMRGLRKRGVTLGEIARVFAVSVSTVKRATDHVPSLREVTKQERL